MKTDLFKLNIVNVFKQFFSEKITSIINAINHHTLCIKTDKYSAEHVQVQSREGDMTVDPIQ